MLNLEPYRVKIYYNLKTNIGFMNQENYNRQNATENGNDRCILKLGYEKETNAYFLR